MKNRNRNRITKTYTKKFVDKLKQDIEDLMSYDQFERCEDCGRLHPARYQCPNCRQSYCEEDAAEKSVVLVKGWAAYE